MFKAVAERLGNTAAVCINSYIHPYVVDSFLGERLALLEVAAKRGLRQHESAFLSLLRAAEFSTSIGSTRLAKCGHARPAHGAARHDRH